MFNEMMAPNYIQLKYHQVRVNLVPRFLHLKTTIAIENKNENQTEFISFFDCETEKVVNLKKM